MSTLYLSTANFRSYVRNPKTIFTFEAALTKDMSACPQLIIDLMSGIQKLSFTVVLIKVRKQPIIALHFESENELKFYNLEARSPGPNVTLVLEKHHN